MCPFLGELPFQGIEIMYTGHQGTVSNCLRLSVAVPNKAHQVPVYRVLPKIFGVVVNMNTNTALWGGYNYNYSGGYYIASIIILVCCTCHTKCGTPSTPVYFERSEFMLYCLVV